MRKWACVSQKSLLLQDSVLFFLLIEDTVLECNALHKSLRQVQISTDNKVVVSIIMVLNQTYRTFSREDLYTSAKPFNESGWQKPLFWSIFQLEIFFKNVHTVALNTVFWTNVTINLGFSSSVICIQSWQAANSVFAATLALCVSVTRWLLYMMY